MSELEMSIAQKLAEAIEKLDEKQKEYLRGMADGMALASKSTVSSESV